MGQSRRIELGQVGANNGANLFAPIRPYFVAPTSAYVVVSVAPTSAYVVVSVTPTSVYVVVSVAPTPPPAPLPPAWCVANSVQVRQLRTGESERVWANNGANLFAPIRPYSVAPTSAYVVVSVAPTSAYVVVSRRRHLIAIRYRSIMPACGM